MSAHHIELFIQTILAVEGECVNSAAPMKGRLCLVERIVSSLNVFKRILNTRFLLKWFHTASSIQKQE